MSVTARCTCIHCWLPTIFDGACVCEICLQAYRYRQGRFDRRKPPLPVGARCAYCGQPATGWDHVKAKFFLGSDGPANLVPACTQCNNQHGGETRITANRMSREGAILVHVLRHVV